MTRIQENAFAAACYDMCCVEDLEAALACKPDRIDMREWGLTAEEWRAQIEMAIKAKRETE